MATRYLFHGNKFFVIKFSVALLLLTGLAGCEKKAGEVTMEVDNKEVYFLDSISDKHWLTYKDESERSKAQNIITYSLTNTTDKKLLFVFDQLTLEPSLGIFPNIQHYGFAGFTISDKGGKIRIPTATMVTPAEGGDLVECSLYELEKKRDRYTKLGVKQKAVFDFDNYLHNAVIINPGEKRIFKAILYLPLIWERDERTNSGNLSYKDLAEGDALKILYYCKAADLKKSLPNYVKDDLAKNNIEIFDGKLEASPIKLKQR